MTLTMIFFRSFVDMVKLRYEDLDYAETRAIGWKLSVLATITTKIEIANLL